MKINVLMLIKAILIGFCLFFCLVVDAQIKLPALISNGMVLQRDTHIPIWGWASPGETVTVKFNGKTYTTKAGTDKAWKLKLSPLKAGGPFDMNISASNRISIKNILIGDVYVCSGQSNMEFKMGGVKDKYAAEIASSTNSQIRQLTVKNTFGFLPQNDITTEGWVSADPQTVLKFTAVGYFYAKALYEKYKIPIGLIHSSWGGTPAEAWTSEDALKEFPDYYTQATTTKDPVNVEDIKKKDKAEIDKWNTQLNNMDKGFPKSGKNWSDIDVDKAAWKTFKVPGLWISEDSHKNAGVAWFSKEIYIPEVLAGKDATLVLGNLIDQDSTYFNGVNVGFTLYKYMSREYKIPGKLIHSGKNQVTVRIVCTYWQGGFTKDKPYHLSIGDWKIDLATDWRYQQGASISPMPRETVFPRWPSVLYNGMIAPLIPYAIKGVIWYQGENNAGRAYEYRNLFPNMITNWRDKWGQGNFPFLYVQLANFMGVKNQPTESTWAELREAQSMALSLPNTGMAVIHDIGDAKDIHPKNKQDVGSRLAIAAQKVVYGEKKAVFSGPTYQSMKVDGNRIILSFKNTGGGLVSKGGDLKYFAIAGADKKFVWANASIKGNTVTVWNETVSTPVAVRYAWADNPDGCNLYNKEGLPASSFRTDDWPGLTVSKSGL